MNWFLLYLAIFFEVGGTASLKVSDGISRPGYFLLGLVLYLLSLSALALALKTLPVGVSYAIWAGVGTLMAVVIGMVWFAEALTPLRGLFMVMILVGAVGLNLVDE
jgi:small multidrug resistance pump